MGSSFGNQIFQGTNPAEQYQKMEADNAKLASNSLDDAIRQNQIATGKETTAQEKIKTQEINNAWQAHRSYADLMAKHTKLTPADGYYEGSDPNSAGAAVSGGSPGSPSVQAGSTNAIAPAMDGAVNASADSGLGGMAGVPPPKKRMDPNNPATYKVDVDHDAVIKGMTAAGYGPEALKEDDSRKAALIKTVELHTKEYELQAKKQAGLANILATVPKTDFNEQDPQKLQQQRQASETGAMQQLHLGVQQGIIDPSQEKTLEQWISGGPWNPEKQQLIGQLADSATASAEQHREAANAVKDHLAKLTGESLADEREQTSLTKGLANSAQTAAGISDQKSLDSWYSSLKPKLQDQFKGVYSRGYSPQTVAAIKSMGQTEENRTKDAETRAQHEAVNAQREEAAANSNELRRMSIDVRRDALQLRKDQKKDGETADQKKAVAEIYDYEKKELPLYSKIGALQAALGKQDPKGYVLGNKTIIMDKESMQDELDQARSDAKGLISKKYALIDKFGGTVKVSQKEMEDKIDGVGKGKKAQGGSGSAAEAITPGNIELEKQPVVKNADGSQSTVRSISIEENGKEVLIPTVAHDGSRILSNKEAIDQYHQSGKHLGIFRDAASATEYAKKLHEDYESGKIKMQPRGGQQPAPTAPERNGKDTGKTLDAKNPDHLAKAREYLQKAGGDKTKARALAKADGYSF